MHPCLSTCYSTGRQGPTSHIIHGSPLHHRISHPSKIIADKILADQAALRSARQHVPEVRETIAGRIVLRVFIEVVDSLLAIDTAVLPEVSSLINTIDIYLRARAQYAVCV